jgi:hypothetical protein
MLALVRKRPAPVAAAAMEGILDAILAATQQVPREQWATARYALADAIGGEPEAAYCEGALDDENGICVRARDTLLFVRFDERGLAVTFLGSLRGGLLTEITMSRQGMMDTVGEFDVRLRYEHLGHQLSIQTPHWQLEKVAPIRDVLRRWSSGPN